MGFIVQLINVNKTYNGTINKQTLFDINLSLEEGSFNSLVGESGSGKSTLLNVIGTLDKPSSGEVRWSPKFGQVVKSGFCSVK